MCDLCVYVYAWYQIRVLAKLVKPLVLQGLYMVETLVRKGLI